MTELIPVLRPELPTAEALLPYLRRMDANRTYTNFGPLHDELQDRLESAFRCPKGGVTLASSGTAALVGAVLASAGRADPRRPYALIPAFSFAATALAAELCGYVPRMVDVSPQTWAIDAKTTGELHWLDEVGVVIAAAPFGRPFNAASWRAFRERTGIPVVIDAAACFEALLRAAEECVTEIPAVLSFHATKAFATGEGGAIVTTDIALAERISQTLNFGFVDSRETHLPGINGKLSEYHSAVGLAELDSWTVKQVALLQIAQWYRDSAQLLGIDRLLCTAPEVGSTYVLFKAATPAEARKAEHFLQEHGIGYRYWYGRALPAHPHFSGLAAGSCGNAEHLAGTVLGLPASKDLSRQDIRLICKCLAQAVAA